MLFVWIALWTASALLLAANRSSAVVRWLSLVAFCGGSGALASLMDGWIPALEAAGRVGAGTSREHALRLLQRGCSWVSYYGMPYAFLCFAAAYSHDPQAAASGGRTAVSGAVAGGLPLAALLPPLAMLAVPWTEHTPVHYGYLAVWAIPYAAAGTALMLGRKSRHPADRRAHTVLVAAVLPAVLIALAMNYVLPLFGLYGMWRYNVWPIAAAFLIFIVALFNFGFLGVQLLIERRRLDYSLRAITSGTAMLNHAIKNDIGKIKLFSAKIERAPEAGAELREDIRVIADAAAHIEAMIRSVHERTQELRLQPAALRLAPLVRAQVAALEPRFRGGGIAVTADCDESAEVFADAAQTAEAIGNVLANAVEAMPDGGELHVRVIGGRRGSAVVVRDTGCGIEKRLLRKVTEPFYTTKGGKTLNFGLGLAYCSQLMSRQGGELRLQSAPGKGTTVSFHFPAMKTAKGAKR